MTFGCHECGTKKKILPKYWLGTLTTELRESLGELSHLLDSYVTHTLHIARISNAESIKCLKMKDGKLIEL